MPKTIPLVSELEWKAVSLNSARSEHFEITRYTVVIWTEETCMRLSNSHNTVTCWFMESCRQKLLAAMDSYGKVEEAEHWKQLSSIANDLSSPHAKALLELRARIESLEGKK